MGVTGDFEKLDKLRAQIRELTWAGFRQELADELGRTTMKLVADEFRGERDPYGEPWAPLKAARRRGARQHARILRDTGRMAASVNYQVTGSGFRVNVPVEYAPYHQGGTTVMPQRRLLPDGANGLGPIYLDAYNRSAAVMIRRKLEVAA